MECIFCKIGKKEMDAEVIYEDDSTLAFLDINPVAPGHTMVIPKAHGENIVSFDFETVESVFDSVKIVTKMIEDGLKPHGFNIGINHGKNAGQAIDHLHVHIIPRFEGDGGGSMHTIVQNPPKQQTVEEIGGIIRSQSHEEKPEHIPHEAVHDDEIEEILQKAKKLAEEKPEEEQKREEEKKKQEDKEHKHHHKRWDEQRTP